MDNSTASNPACNFFGSASRIKQESFFSIPQSPLFVGPRLPHQHVEGLHPAAMLAHIPPHGNTGVNSHTSKSGLWAPTSQTSIDYLSFTIKSESLFLDPEVDMDDSSAAFEYELFAQHVLNEVFGLQLGQTHDYGRKFYKKHAEVLDMSGERLKGAMVCYCGNGGIHFDFTGSVCENIALSVGFERCAYFLQQFSHYARINRIDLALDAFEGQFTVDDAVQAYHCKGFQIRTGNVKVRTDGDWIHNQERTLYVGSRESGKMARIYEKGQQLGDENSPWVRAEAEIRSKQRHIPIDVLLDPDKYFAGAYPWFKTILMGMSPVDVEPVCIKTKVLKKTEIELKQAISYAKNQFGKLYTTLFHRLQMPASEILSLVSRPINDGVPNRLRSTLQNMQLACT